MTSSADALAHSLAVAEVRMCSRGHLYRHGTPDARCPACRRDADAEAERIRGNPRSEPPNRARLRAVCAQYGHAWSDGPMNTWWCATCARWEAK